MSLQWMSLQWMSLRWLSLQWLSLQWPSLRRMHHCNGCVTAMDASLHVTAWSDAVQLLSQQWLSQQWLSLQWLSQQWQSQRLSNDCHSSNFQFSRDVSHESFVFTSIQLSLFEGRLARKLRFHIFHFQILSLAGNAFLKFSGCTKCCVLPDKTCLGRWMGEGLPTRSVRVGSCSDRPSIGIDSSGFIFKLSSFEGSLAQKLHFHIFNFQLSAQRLPPKQNDNTYSQMECCNVVLRVYVMHNMHLVNM